MLISGIDDNHHGWWIITVLGWLRTWWTPYQNGHSAPLTGIHPLEWPFQEEPGSGSTASAPVSDVSSPACTNEVCPPLRPVSVAQKNKPSTMLSSNVQSIDLLVDCMAWRFWTMRQLNGCSTPAPRSSAVKQWFETNDGEEAMNSWLGRKKAYTYVQQPINTSSYPRKLPLLKEAVTTFKAANANKSGNDSIWIRADDAYLVPTS